MLENINSRGKSYKYMLGLELGSRLILKNLKKNYSF